MKRPDLALGVERYEKPERPAAQGRRALAAPTISRNLQRIDSIPPFLGSHACDQTSELDRTD
jgi:hypothetical protein